MNAIPFVSRDDLDTMIRTLSGECRSEPLNGQIGVAYVIRNRATDPGKDWWGDTISEVCLKPYQFSCWLKAVWNTRNLKHMTDLRSTDAEYRALELVCLDVLHGNVPDPTHGATHYKVSGTPASWDKAIVNMTPVVIGHHEFYKLGSTG